MDEVRAVLRFESAGALMVSWLSGPGKLGNNFLGWKTLPGPPLPRGRTLVKELLR